MHLHKLFSVNFFGNILAIIAGCLLTFAFAPFSIFSLAIVAPAILLALVINISPGYAFLRGWLFGLGFFSSGVYWIYISIHTFGNTPVAFAALITACFVSLLALFPATNVYLLNRYFPHFTYTKIICAFPAIWVFLEWFRSWICTGFPWLFLGYSQINSPLRGYAPIFSVYGVSLAVALCSGLLVSMIIFFKRKQTSLGYLTMFGFALAWVIGGVLCTFEWTKPFGNLTKISMIQGNIAQSLKWSPDEILPTISRYRKLTSQNWDSRLIIWPESAIPVVLQNTGNLIDTLSNEAHSHDAALIMGIPVEAEQPGSYYNSIITIGNGNGVYAKQQLVPFGEYVPLSKWFNKLFALLDIPMASFIPGSGATKPITIDELIIAPFICYEIAFPELVRDQNTNIGAILTMSNDAWFGKSIAQAQHLEMAQMRALEMGRPVLSVSNDGITAFINHKGKLQSQAPQYQEFVLTDSIQASKGQTPWQRNGMDPILLILTGLLLAALHEEKQAKRKDKSPVD